MITITYYTTATGEITQQVDWEDETLSVDYSADKLTTESVFVGDVNVETQYLPAGVVTPRPQIIVDDDNIFHIPADGTTLVDFALPTGTVVTFDGADSAASTASEHFQFKSVLAGQFEFSIEPPFPYLPTIVEVHTYAV